ncbi:MAG: hypothetical protein GY759_05815 [Chloroflexi bacterium]|nr:hypothetical protein [Chloroflexota bacterium]
MSPISDLGRHFTLAGLDMVWSAPLGFTSFANIQQHGERYQDEWGAWYGSDESSWPGAWMENFVVNNREEWRKVQFPDPRLPERVAQPKRALELVEGELAVVAGVRGPFSATWMLSGMENISRWVIKEPDLLEDVLREMGRWNTEMGLFLIESGVDAIMIHDDWGMNMGTLVKPEHWKRHFLPYIAEEVETLAATGTPIIMHSDGNLNAIMDEIIQLPISALNPIQRNSGMDLAALKQTYENRLCLIGNISASLTLAHGKPDDVELEALECIRDAGPGGASIMAPDHSYHNAIPTENVWRVFETCKAYGRYPLDMDVITTRIEELIGQGAGLGWAVKKPDAQKDVLAAKKTKATAQANICLRFTPCL